MVMRVEWVLATAVILAAIAFFAVWRPPAADEQAANAERERIRRLVTQPGAGTGNGDGQNKP